VDHEEVPFQLLLTLLILWFLRPTRRWGKLGLLVLMLGAMAALHLQSTLDRFGSRHEEVFVDQWQRYRLGGRGSMESWVEARQGAPVDGSWDRQLFVCGDARASGDEE
jgi:hypothetical protein